MRLLGKNFSGSFCHFATKKISVSFRFSSDESSETKENKKKFSFHQYLPQTQRCKNIYLRRKYNGDGQWPLRPQCYVNQRIIAALNRITYEKSNYINVCTEELWMSKMKLNFDIPYKIIAKDKYIDIHFLLKPYFSWELIKINHKNSKSGFSDFSQWKLIYSFIHW